MYENGYSDAAWRQLLCRKQTLAHTDAIPCTIEDHDFFKQTEFTHKDTSQSTQMTKRERGKP